MLQLLFINLLMALSLLNAAMGQTVKAVELADNLLPEGSQKAAFTHYAFPENIRSLQARAVNNLKANPEWADKYIVKMVERGVNDLKYMDAYGLSRNEFDLMLAGFRNGQQPVYTDTFNLTIKRTNGIISFKGEKKATAFDLLRIDTKLKQISYDNFLITKELEIKGKFYAPILFGFETHDNTKLTGKKQQSPAITSAGLSIGKNKGSDRATMCLILARPGSSGIAEFEFLTITLL